MSSQYRAHERRNKIIKTAWSGLLARIVSVSVSLLIVPLAVHYLGAEQYGLWIAVSSLVAMLGFMDGGAGNAVINLVAHASGSKNADLPKIVSTAFFCLMALAVTGCLLFLAVFPFVSWDKLLGVAGTISVADLNIVVIIVGVFFFLSIFTTLVGKIQRGLQEGNLDNFWSGVAALLSLLFVYLAIQKEMGLIGFVIAFLGGSLFAYLGSNIHYLLIHRAELRPRLSNVDKTIAKHLFAVSGMFFVLQIGGAIQMQADNVIIANMLGAEAVTNYAICMKLFLLMPMLFSLLFTPLWPAYREAIANGDMQWVRRIFLKSMRWAVLISIPSAIGLIILGGKIIELWIGHDAVPSTNLLIGCGIWMIISTLGGTAAMLANARQLMTPQIIAVILSGSINIVTTIWLIPYIGVEGAVYGTIIAYLLGVVPIYCIVLPKALR